MLAPKIILNGRQQCTRIRLALITFSLILPNPLPAPLPLPTPPQVWTWYCKHILDTTKQTLFWPDSLPCPGHGKYPKGKYADNNKNIKPRLYKVTKDSWQDCSRACRLAPEKYCEFWVWYKEDDPHWPKQCRFAYEVTHTTDRKTAVTGHRECDAYLGILMPKTKKLSKMRLIK